MSFHYKTHSLGLRAALFSAMLLSAMSASAATITLDGILTDVASAVSASTINTASAVDGTNETNSSSQAVENGNGFDIKNVYSYYDPWTDTLYLGMNAYGAIGDSATSGTYERPTSCGTGTPPLLNCNRSYFDSNETYRFGLYLGTSTSGTNLLSYTVTGNDPTKSGTVWTDGGDSASSTNPYILTINRLISEANNGVEYSITGLNLSGAMPYHSNLLIFFGAGSGDLNSISAKAEDTAYLQMVNVVPVPAAVWLFGSGLAGLLGLSIRKGIKR